MIPPAPACRVRDRCALCADDGLEMVLRLAPSPAGNALASTVDGTPPTFPLELMRCRACGHVQLSVTLDRLAVLGRPDAGDGASPRRTAIAQALAHSLAERVQPAQGALVVDIGSGDGTFLKVFEERGQRVQGVEPAVNLAGEAIRASVPTHPGLFSPAIADRIEETRGRAALIVAHQAFAEADDPRAFLEGVRLLLRREGVFAFSVHSLAAIVEDGRLDHITHRALAYHGVAPLRRCLAACDFELFAISAEGGRLDGLAQPLGGPHVADGSVERLAAREAELGLADGAAFGPFAGRLARLIAAVTAEVLGARDAGAHVAAVGAGCGATTWLSQLGETVATAIDFLADDLPERQGRFSPAFARPIGPLDWLALRRPDLVLLFDPDEEAALRRRLAPLLGDGVRLISLGGPAALAAR